MDELIVVARAPAGNEIAQKHPDSDPDRDGLIRMLMHGLISHFGPFYRPLASASIYLPAPIQGGGESFAGFADFFSGHVGGGNHQGPGIVGQVAHFIADRLCLFVHLFCVFCWLVFFNGRFSALTKWVASGELTTFRIEFLPPKGLGTVSSASGSGIH